MKKYGSGTYREGFAEGWRSVLGVNPAIPEFLVRPIPAGKTPYQTGYEHGAEIARSTKGS
jgi:hypothetical protein